MTTTTTTETTAPRARTADDDRRAYDLGMAYAQTADVGDRRHLRKTFTESLADFDNRDREILRDVFDSGYRLATFL